MKVSELINLLKGDMKALPLGSPEEAVAVKTLLNFLIPSDLDSFTSIDPDNTKRIIFPTSRQARNASIATLSAFPEQNKDIKTRVDAESVIEDITQLEIVKKEIRQVIQKTVSKSFTYIYIPLKGKTGSISVQQLHREIKENTRNLSEFPLDWKPVVNEKLFEKKSKEALAALTKIFHHITEKTLTAYLDEYIATKKETEISALREIPALFIETKISQTRKKIADLLGDGYQNNLRNDIVKNILKELPGTLYLFRDDDILEYFSKDSQKEPQTKIQKQITKTQWYLSFDSLDAARKIMERECVKKFQLPAPIPYISQYNNLEKQCYLLVLSTEELFLFIQDFSEDHMLLPELKTLYSLEAKHFDPFFEKHLGITKEIAEHFDGLLHILHEQKTTLAKLKLNDQAITQEQRKLIEQEITQTQIKKLKEIIHQNQHLYGNPKFSVFNFLIDICNHQNVQIPLIELFKLIDEIPPGSKSLNRILKDDELLAKTLARFNSKEEWIKLFKLIPTQRFHVGVLTQAMKWVVNDTLFSEFLIQKFEQEGIPKNLEFNFVSKILACVTEENRLDFFSKAKSNIERKEFPSSDIVNFLTLFPKDNRSYIFLEIKHLLQIDFYIKKNGDNFLNVFPSREDGIKALVAIKDKDSAWVYRAVWSYLIDEVLYAEDAVNCPIRSLQENGWYIPSFILLFEFCFKEDLYKLLRSISAKGCDNEGILTVFNAYIPTEKRSQILLAIEKEGWNNKNILIFFSLTPPEKRFDALLRIKDNLENSKLHSYFPIRDIEYLFDLFPGKNPDDLFILMKDLILNASLNHTLIEFRKLFQAVLKRSPCDLYDDFKETFIKYSTKLKSGDSFQLFKDFLGETFFKLYPNIKDHLLTVASHWHLADFTSFFSTFSEKERSTLFHEWKNTICLALKKYHPDTAYQIIDFLKLFPKEIRADLIAIFNPEIISKMIFFSGTNPTLSTLSKGMKFLKNESFSSLYDQFEPTFFAKFLKCCPFEFFWEFESYSKEEKMSLLSNMKKASLWQEEDNLYNIKNKILISCLIKIYDKIKPDLLHEGFGFFGKKAPTHIKDLILLGQKLQFISEYPPMRPYKELSSILHYIWQELKHVHSISNLDECYNEIVKCIEDAQTPSPNRTKRTDDFYKAALQEIKEAQELLRYISQTPKINPPILQQQRR